jgi:3',5'-cyclic AMP phosphodiesterase CpdA
MKLVWISDPHLEFPTDKVVRKFIAKIAGQKPDAVLITGDISLSGNPLNGRPLEVRKGLRGQDLNLRPSGYEAKFSSQKACFLTNFLLISAYGYEPEKEARRGTP